MLDQIVAGLVLLVVAVLIIALYLADRRADKLRAAALKAEMDAGDKVYQENQQKLTEAIDELEQQRQEHLHNLDLLKHAEWRPGDGPRLPDKL